VQKANTSEENRRILTYVQIMAELAQDIEMAETIGLPGSTKWSAD
jgi:hypothetical protein